MVTAAERRLAALGGRRIGPHLQRTGSLRKAADRAGAIGATAVQVFVDNPTAWQRRTEPPVGIEAFRARLAALDIRPVAVHASYLVNLCGSDDAFWARSVETMEAELLMAERWGASLVNVHVGSHRGLGREQGIERLARGVRAVLDRVPATPGAPAFVLENAAGSGDGIGSTIEDLADILDAAGRAGVDTGRMGFCLDTAHLWGAGYVLDDPEAIDVLLTRVDQLLGPGGLRMMHLNDSRAPKGSLRDRHEHIGAGLIGAAGLTAILTHPRLNGIPMYLETPAMDRGYDKRNMDRVRALIAGRELPPLGRAAFAPRRARSIGARRTRAPTAAAPSSEGSTADR